MANREAHAEGPNLEAADPESDRDQLDHREVEACLEHHAQHCRDRPLAHPKVGADRDQLDEPCREEPSAGEASSLRGDRDLHLVVVAVPMDQALEEAQGGEGGEEKRRHELREGARVEEVSLGLLGEGL